MPPCGPSKAKPGQLVITTSEQVIGSLVVFYLALVKPNGAAKGDDYHSLFDCDKIFLDYSERKNNAPRSSYGDNQPVAGDRSRS